MSDSTFGEPGCPLDEPRPLPSLREIPYWAISAVLHLMLLLILSAVVIFEARGPEFEDRTIVRQAFAPPWYDPNRIRDPIRRPATLEEQVPNPILELKPTEITPEIPNGANLDALTNRNHLENSVSFAIGTEGATPRSLGLRHGKGSLVREGGSRATEDAVLAALHWLRRHQHPDGHWSARDFVKRCVDPETGCLHERPEIAYTDGRGEPDHDVGVTALAMLAFLGYGHTHRSGEWRDFRSVVRKALRWMRKVQVVSNDPRTRGRYGPARAENWIYDHAIATMAMGELLALSQDSLRLAKSVQEATNLSLRHQNPGSGWRYRYREGSDSSVTGWMVLALKTSKACSEVGLLRYRHDEFEEPLRGALRWFDQATSVSGKTGYFSPGDPGSQLQGTYPDPYPFLKDEVSCMTAVALLCRLFAGTPRRDPVIKRGVGILMKALPRWSPAAGKRKSHINMYYWYYGTYALFQHGGEPWRAWNRALTETLLEHQRVGGCEDGSWDPIGEWGAVGGRIYSTALCAMSLEVYYRFVRATGSEFFELDSRRPRK